MEHNINLTYVRLLLVDKHGSVSQAARKLKVTREHLSRALRGKQKISDKLLTAMMKEIGIW